MTHSKNSTTNSKNNSVKKLLDDRRIDTTTTDVFIIGGGSSYSTYVTPEIHEILKTKKNVIACNNAYKLYPNALCCHFSDFIWYQWHIEPVHNLHGNFHGTVTTAGAAFVKIFPGNDLVHSFNKQTKVGISVEPNTVAGMNAGHQAINIAVNQGFKNIFLIGFDMNPDTKAVHWHTEHRRTTNTDLYKKNMIPDMVKIVPYQDQLNFKIYNTNPESNLKCFEFKTLNEILF